MPEAGGDRQAVETALETETELRRSIGAETTGKVYENWTLQIRLDESVSEVHAACYPSDGCGQHQEESNCTPRYDRSIGFGIAGRFQVASNTVPRFVAADLAVRSTLLTEDPCARKNLGGRFRGGNDVPCAMCLQG